MTAAIVYQMKATANRYFQTPSSGKRNSSTVATARTSANPPATAGSWPSKGWRSPTPPDVRTPAVPTRTDRPRQGRRTRARRSAAQPGRRTRSPGTRTTSRLLGALVRERTDRVQAHQRAEQHAEDVGPRPTSVSFAAPAPNAPLPPTVPLASTVPATRQAFWRSVRRVYIVSFGCSGGAARHRRDTPPRSSRPACRPPLPTPWTNGPGR